MRSVELAAARYRLGRVTGESLILLAVELLAEGHDEAVELAVADDPAMREVGPLFEDLCAELGEPIPDSHKAADIVVGAILGEIVDGTVQPKVGLQQLMDDVYWPYVANERESGPGHDVGETHDLQHLIGAYWSYDELRERPTELSVDGEFGDAAIARLDEHVKGFANDWLAAHTANREWVCNDAMRQLLLDLERDSGAPGVEMPPWLHELLASGLVERGGALLLRQADDANAPHTKRDQFPDLTGYEAYINHFHIDRQDDTLGDLRIACVAVDEIRRQLHELPIDQPVRICVSRDLSGEYINSTIRFHRLRPSETWLASDLEGYDTEAIGFLDVTPSKVAH